MSEAQNESRPVVDPEAEGLPGTADDDSSAYDDTASARVADGPDPAALPADHPIASLDYGTTPAEAATAEPLADRLDREEPEPDPYAEAADPQDPTDPANVSDRPDPGDDTIEPDELSDASPAEVTGVPGAGPGVREPDGTTSPDRLSASPDAVGDGPDPDGRLTGAPSDGLVDVTGADLTDSDELDPSEDTVPDTTALDPVDASESFDNQSGRIDAVDTLDERPGRLVAPDEGAHPDREGTEIAYDAGSTAGLTAEEAALHEER
ncbi:DUF5709 domain-containing protein [Kribbella lupini]|uniref:DUF5709 domain-containing protein n=1 Tax=Kribbella lupini TaxID=291602 RepID=A0ABN2CAT8_9ACTN